VARVTADEYAEKWARRLKAAAPDITRGVERVTVAPGKKAAEAQQLMLDRLTASILDGTWAARVSGVSLEDWKQALIQKGVGRIASGVDAASPKQAAMAVKLLAAVDSAVAKVNTMPKGDIEQSIARMTTFTREMHKAKIRRPGS